MSDRKSFSDSVIHLPGEGGSARSDLALEATGPEDATEKMMVSFSLAIDPAAQSELERLIAEGIRVSPEDLNTKYAVPEADLNPLLAWLNAQGFEVIRVSADRRSVYAKASVEQIERSLGVHMVRVKRDGVTYIAAKDAPSLPADIAARVFAIGGLQPFLTANKQSASAPTGEPRAEFGDPYSPLELLQAYNMLTPGTGTPLGTGKNQVIAILIDYLPLPADLEKFWRSFWLPVDQKRVTLINLNNVHMPPPPLPPPLTDPLLETSLDTEWASSIAREALIRVYACGSLKLVDLDFGLNAIIDDVAKIPNLNQVSLSWASGESYVPTGSALALHQHFVTLSALGVSVFAASGDAGSNPDKTGHKPLFPLGLAQTAFPASDPYVIAVGGTELYMKQGAVSAETGWTGSGGGKSSQFHKPDWQITGAVYDLLAARLVPDVSAVASDRTPAQVVCRGELTATFGTSWSTPVWAGIFALINEAREKKSLPKLSPLNQYLYGLPSDCIRDITQGNNGAYNCQKGYDWVTGIGVPNVQNLIRSLTEPHPCPSFGIQTNEIQEPQVTTWNFDLPPPWFSEPVLMLTLKNASYRGGFGYSPRCTTLTRTSAGIDMGNWGAHLFCAAIGNWRAPNQPLHIESGSMDEDTDFDVPFPNGAFSQAPAVFVSLQEYTYTGQIGNTPSVVSVTPDHATIRPNNTGMRVHWVAIGPGGSNTDRIKIQRTVIRSDQEGRYTWNFDSVFSGFPTVIVSLQQGTYDGNFGRPPQLVNVGSSAAVIRSNNWGCILHCVAFGT